MIGKFVILPETETVEVELKSDKDGVVSLGIRINGSDFCVMALRVSLPEPESSRSWSKSIGDIMATRPSAIQ